MPGGCLLPDVLRDRARPGISKLCQYVFGVSPSQVWKELKRHAGWLAVVFELAAKKKKDF